MKWTWLMAGAAVLALSACSSPSNGSNSSGSGGDSDVVTTGSTSGEDGGTTDGTATGGDTGTGDTGTGDSGTGDTSGTTDTGGAGATGGAGTTGGGAGTTGGDPCDPPCGSGTVCKDGTCQEPIICEAGGWICEGLTSKKQCNDTGTAFLEAESCPGDQYCTNGGQCGLKCSLDPKWGAYVGCVFWSVDTPTWDDPTLPNASTLPHAVVISNPSELEATVTFTPPPGVSFTFNELIVPGTESKVFLFPSLDTGGSGIYDLGIRIESNRPILVHQFNPWDNTFSNDASLLLPEPLLGQEYLVMSWPTDTRCLLVIPGLPGFGGPCSHGTVTIVAPTDNTEVTIRASARINASELEQNEPTTEIDAIPKGGIATFVLNKGQVLNLDAMPEDLFTQADLTGTLILSNKPVAVFSGHDSASVAAPIDPPGGGFPGGEESDTCCLDHLEEQMIPVSLLGQEYIAAKSADRGGEHDIWRIVAADDNVSITTDPPIDGLHGEILAKRGDWIESHSQNSFVIKATGRVLVGQYLVAQGQTQDGTGDPAMILAIPVERFRSTYPLMVPPQYAKDYVSVVRKPGTTVEVDGVAVGAGEFKPFAGGTWELAWVLISDGIHTISGDQPFALSAYGYNSAASYGYPGGMTIPGEANP
ncbi:MAG: hypothetical protein ACI9WU_003459 [Myxococcota bacterium]|jgi:hypothetical protein